MRLLAALFSLILLPISLVGQPQAYMAKTVYDFGSFREEAGPQTGTFVIQNLGDEDLIILSGRATCGCTTPDYPRRPIAPGDSAIISVTYDPAARPGKFKKQVYLETNSNPSTVRLDIRGVVIGSAHTLAGRFPHPFGPVRLAYPAIMLGEMPKGRLRTNYFEGYNHSDFPVALKLEHTPKFVDVTFVPDTVGAGEQFTIMTYVNTAKAPNFGLLTDSICFSADTTRIALPLSLSVDEDFTSLSAKELKEAPAAKYSATKVNFGEIKGPAPLTAFIEITNVGKKPLEIRQILCPSQAIKAEVSADKLKKGKSLKIALRLNPEMMDSRLLNEKITVITNDPLNPKQSIRVTALK